MIIKQITLSNHAKDQLSRLKGKTGIQNWNVLCRWAVCLSLREPTVPMEMVIPSDSNVEMSWHVFGGDHHEIFEALIIQRCINDNLGTDPATLSKYFRLHLHRGISYLSSSNLIKSIEDLLTLATENTLFLKEEAGNYL
ncbi:DNA sulfur modification protein DndE [Cohnella faecalis]|uniref:DNA sulfur modification protein DndE n=1 Tax=Cohnella faecalis TaxID=2315694 RepID=A0A398CGA3_9BACL|nr:DNA sulfur modification protein DndE [Cohnella faecalis]